MKKEFEKSVNITHHQMYKLDNYKDITTDVIGSICADLGMKPNDIIEVICDNKWVRFIGHWIMYYIIEKNTDNTNAVISRHWER